jgi:hypothetical protein
VEFLLLVALHPHLGNIASLERVSTKRRRQLILKAEEEFQGGLCLLSEAIDTYHSYVNLFG